MGKSVEDHEAISKDDPLYDDFKNLTDRDEQQAEIGCEINYNP
jgi:hypothetical protein